VVTKSGKAKGSGDKPKAQKVEISQLVILSAYEKTFSSGKPGFFGKGLEPATGKRYQIIGAVEIAG
jgi:hypothetical protein